ncbi:hypothetical protein CCR97_12800 [Rhodoplanes elegans]|uniref:hypothetical protein n=1 Tax=Rhodoplanes elegans TaxID=29408 RepID=UPI00191491F7|nr:hypothetical protein [Rhodoplanes elegans]MBK5959081.1 hypothetical protein [Rhodoplanes elegans]
MTIPCRFERSVLAHDAHALVVQSHHPALYDLGLDALKGLRLRLRELRDRERTLARQKRREVRGKVAPRGGSFPGTAEQPLRRKQVFSAALKRVNKEIDRQERLAARTAHAEAARRALEMRRAAWFPPRPAAGETAGDGMRPLPSQRRKAVLPPARIGRVSQATKRAQAARDARG